MISDGTLVTPPVNKPGTPKYTKTTIDDLTIGKFIYQHNIIKIRLKC